jgi:hypothetical protein
MFLNCSSPIQATENLCRWSEYSRSVQLMGVPLMILLTTLSTGPWQNSVDSETTHDAYTSSSLLVPVVLMTKAILVLEELS